MMKPQLHLEEVSKVYRMQYGEICPLKNISLGISRGENLSIMGPSGSGKSTLLHILGCLDRPTSGRYLFGEQDVKLLSDDELSRIRAETIGFVFQSFNLIPHLTVYENILVPFQYQRTVQNEPHEEILKAVERVNLSHRLHHHPNELSGGEMQRVAIARTLAIQPEIILADEPTGNLDSKNSKEIVKLLMDINAQGVTVVIITHDANVASQFQRVIKMQDGNMIMDSK